MSVATRLLGGVLLVLATGCGGPGEVSVSTTVAPSAASSSASASASTVSTTVVTTATTTATTTTPLPSVTVWVPDPEAPQLLVPEIIGTSPHDRTAFTQGLVFRDGRFYESTGQYRESTVRIVDATTGEVLRSRSLDGRYFGEGLEVVGDRVVQLTWREEIAFIWDAETLEPLGTYSYEGEGWGLCARDGAFIMSDGSSRLTVRDLDTFEPIGSIDVQLAGEPVADLNELECTGSWILANVWRTDVIVVIDPATGRVIARIDGGDLAGELSSTDGIDVLNGIAYDPVTNTYYLTGKYWPEVFEVTLSARD